MTNRYGTLTVNGLDYIVTRGDSNEWFTEWRAWTDHDYTSVYGYFEDITEAVFTLAEKLNPRPGTWAVFETVSGDCYDCQF